MSDKYQTLTREEKKIISNISFENPLFRFLPDCYFKVRNTIFYPFHIVVPYLNWSVGFCFALIGVLSMLIAFTIHGFQIEGWKGYVQHGQYASIMLGLTFLFQTKSSLLRLLTGMSLDTQIKIHKVIALSLILLIFGHAFRILNSTYWKFNSQKRVSGAVMSSCVFILALSGVISRIFKVNYNTFIVIHKISFVTIYLAAFIHGAYKVFYFGVFWLWLDLVVFRVITMLLNKYALQDMVLEPIGDQYVKMKFRKKKFFKFQEGQYMYFLFPQYQPLNFHPFSIATSNYDDEFYFIFKRFQKATNWLYKKGQQNLQPFSLIDGPYGGPNVNVENYDFHVFIAGGVGMTPMLSIAKKLQHESLLGKPIKKIIFIWCSKNTLLISEMKKLQAINSQLLELKIFITEEELSLEDKNSALQGRPDLKQELITAQSQALQMDCKEVGLYVCGPMGDDVLSLKDDKDLQRVKFRTHIEVFSTLKI